MSAEAIIITLLITAICAVLVLSVANKNNPPETRPVGGQASATRQNGTLSLFGWLLVWLGLALMGYFFMLYDTSVSVSSGSLYGGTREVENIGLLNNRATGVSLGGYLFIGGSVLACLAGPRKRGEE